MTLPDEDHRRPDGLTDGDVEALGKLSEALETVEQARGHLYAFHQLSGRADLLLQDAVDLLRASDHPRRAADIERRLVGRNVLFGRWTYQVVEEYDDGYWSLFRDIERDARESIAGGVRHLYEAEMKAQQRTPDEPGHEAAPGERS